MGPCVNLDGYRFLSTPSVRRATSTPAAIWPCWIFLSTPSVRRATDSAVSLTHGNAISIHALRTEGDLSFERILDSKWLFLSTPSVRRATFSDYWL